MHATHLAKSIHIHAKLIPCAHSCKYCLMGDKKLSKISTTRFINFVERFLEWKELQGSDVKIVYVLNYSFNYDRETLQLLERLKTRYSLDYPPLRSMLLGGLPWRPDDALQDWLKERQAFGLTNVHASLAGTGAVHDYWNGRPGNFDLIMRTLEMGKRLGMSTAARLFVTKSTLPLLEELNEHLDRLPPHVNDRRYALPFFYAGWGTKLEAERIDEDIRDALPVWFKPLVKASDGEGTWRSEREWIEYIAEHPEPIVDTNLILDLTDDNIERLESMSCDAIVAEYEAKTIAAYTAIPNLHELCDRYGNKENRDVYVLERCIAMKWLDMHLLEHPIEFDRQLTHLQMGH